MWALCVRVCLLSAHGVCVLAECGSIRHSAAWRTCHTIKNKGKQVIVWAFVCHKSKSNHVSVVYADEYLHIPIMQHYILCPGFWLSHRPCVCLQIVQIRKDCFCYINKLFTYCVCKINPVVSGLTRLTCVSREVTVVELRVNW